MSVRPMMKRSYVLVLLITVLSTGVIASDKLAVNTGVDLYSRYIWRGMDFGDAPSVQPVFSVSYAGFELGAWGAYALSGQEERFSEVDFWLGYSREFENTISIGAVLTDYYLPYLGIDISNFNDHDAVDADGAADPGAHVLELGLSFTGPKSFPMTVSGYVGVYNDAGNNTYFQIDYPFSIGETDLTVFCGAAGGSHENPDAYSTEEFALINVGVSAERSVKMSESFSLPLSMAFILNPNEEISYLVAGVRF